MGEAHNLAASISATEIDQQIATARKFPRSVHKAIVTARELIETEEAAGECIYALPRDGKTIEGPSARFAEIMAYAWGNCRVAARIIDEGPEFIVSQGVFFDLERNVAYSVEVQRRVVDSKGKRYKLDMIGVTGNAANSIAARNATLKGIPRAQWGILYQHARELLTGTHATLTTRRAQALQAFNQVGISAEVVFRILSAGGRPVRGERDIGLDDLVALRGLLTAIKDGDTTADALIAEHADPVPAKRADLRGKLAGNGSSPAPADAPPQDQAGGQAGTGQDAPVPENQPVQPDPRMDRGDDGPEPEKPPSEPEIGPVEATGVTSPDQAKAEAKARAPAPDTKAILAQFAMTLDAAADEDDLTAAVEEFGDVVKAHKLQTEANDLLNRRRAQLGLQAKPNKGGGGSAAKLL